MGGGVQGCLHRVEEGKEVIMGGDFRGCLGKGEEQGGSYNRRGRLGVFRERGRGGEWGGSYNGR